MFTLNNVIEQIELFQINHEVLNSFLFQKQPEAGAGSSVNYPVLLCELKDDGSERGESLNSFMFNFAVLDIPNKEGSEANTQEILSDMKQVSDDLVAYFRMTKFDTPLKIQLPVTMNSVTEFLDDECAGWLFSLKISLANRLDLCAIPSTGYTPPIDYNKVRILDSVTGEVLYRIPAGGSFTITQLTNILQNLGTPVTTIVQEIQ